MRLTKPFFCLALLVSSACGGKTEPVDPPSGSSGGGGRATPPGSSGGGGSGGSSGSSSSGGVGPGSCPSYCTYNAENETCACSSPSYCPPSQPLPGTPCTWQEGQCNYPDGCDCSCGTAGVWSCDSECGCPASQPTADSSCYSVGLSCSYVSGGTCNCDSQGNWLCNWGGSSSSSGSGGGGGGSFVCGTSCSSPGPTQYCAPYDVPCTCDNGRWTCPPVLDADGG